MYCTIEDIYKKIYNANIYTFFDIQSDEEISSSAEETLTSIIQSQSSFIDSYINGRYLLPINEPSDLQLLKSFVIILVIDELYNRAITIELPHHFIEKKKQVIKSLEDISNGRTNLKSQKITKANVKGESVYMNKRERIFTDSVIQRLYKY